MGSTTTTMITALAGSIGWGPNAGGPGPWFGAVIPLLWLAVVALVVWLVARRGGGGRRDGMERARGLLAERYAQGELSTDEYRERLEQLH